MKTQIDLEGEIILALDADNFRGNTIHFVWDNIDGLISPEYKKALFVVTNNKWHKTKFLFKRVYGKDEIDCLNKMIEYISVIHPTELNFTVNWTDPNGREHKSYFTAADEEEAKFKFYHLSDEEHSGAKILDIKQTAMA